MVSRLRVLTLYMLTVLLQTLLVLPNELLLVVP
jgi:hypothetical protein